MLSARRAGAAARHGRPSVATAAAGFTLVEMLVALTILALITVTVATQVVGRLNRGEAGALSQNLQTVSAAMYQFRQDVGRFPDSIRHLTTLPATARDLCTRPIPAADRAKWGGPYLTRSVPAGGLVSGSSTFNGNISRNPATIIGTNLQATATLTVNDVDRNVAEELDRAFDGTASLTTGSIRWTAGAGSNRGTLMYDMPISGC